MVAQRSASESARPDSESPPLDERAAFLQALRETMQATLTAERARIADDIERRRAEHVAAVHSRRETVASRIRELADKDREAIAVWAVDEQIRIEKGRQQRTNELERDLELSLAEHDARIDQEIEAAEVAIAAHRAEVEGFFAALLRETDPVTIAQRASSFPRFPSIEINAHAIVSALPRTPEPAAPVVDESVVAASPVAPEPVATASADVPEPAVLAAVDEAGAPEPVPAAPAVPAEDNGKAAAAPVPVMDPIAAKRAEWWAAWKELHEPPELSEVLATVEQEAESSDVLEAVTAGPATAGPAPRPDAPSSGVLLSSIPILRPFNWLRRDRDPNEGANGEK